jgi:hypothetical protein
LLSRAPPKLEETGLLRLARSGEESAQELHHPAAVEVDDDLVMPHALAAFDGTQVAYETMVTVAHASQSTISEHDLENALAADSVKS